jgi:AraC-like DNA-binding protein
MTIYEQIQKALDLIEGGLAGPLKAEDAAAAAGMSLRSFSHWFWAVTGHSYKEYLVARRLAESLRLLSATETRIIDIALEVGYGSHESYSRAFRERFGLSPRAYRRTRPATRGLGRIELAKETYMGIVIKELPELLVAAFEGYEPEPEAVAKALLEAWQKAHPAPGAPRRVFGHNIDREGRLDHNPKNVGYKFMATVQSPAEAGEARLERIAAGRFAVTGIEGSFEEDPSGAWIGEGWRRMNALVAEKGHRVKDCPRWFEEELEPEKPGRLRLDLYLELEG